MICSLFLSDGCDGNAALVELDAQPDPVTRVHHQGALQDHGHLLPVWIRPERADAHIGVQVDVIPEGDGCDLARDIHSNLQKEVYLAKDGIRIHPKREDVQ